MYDDESNGPYSAREQARIHAEREASDTAMRAEAAAEERQKRAADQARRELYDAVNPASAPVSRRNTAVPSPTYPTVTKPITMLQKLGFVVGVCGAILMLGKSGVDVTESPFKAILIAGFGFFLGFVALPIALIALAFWILSSYFQ